MAVVRQSGRKRRSIVEGELGLALGLLKLFVERVNLRPIL